MRDARRWGPATLGLLYGAVLLVAAYHFGPTIRAVVNLPTMILLSTAGVVDLQREVIPDWLTVPSLAWVLAASLFLGWPRLVDALFGIVFCAGIMLLLAVISRGGIGGGDVKLVAVVGASLGWGWGFGVLAFAQVTFAFVALCLFISGRKGRKDALPFGPYLATFALIALLAKPMG
jgi:prepilin signal peptidase PulO-like enzyme (type II secretory pathway)